MGKKRGKKKKGENEGTKEIANDLDDDKTFKSTEVQKETLGILDVGSFVRLWGLKKKKQYNGIYGTVSKFLPNSRYAIDIKNLSDTGVPLKSTLAVKEDNIDHLAHPQPLVEDNLLWLAFDKTDISKTSLKKNKKKHSEVVRFRSLDILTNYVGEHTVPHSMIDNMKGWLVPSIGARSDITCLPEYYIRLRSANLVEALLHEEMSSLRKVIELHNMWLKPAVLEIENAIISLLKSLHPSCEIIEAGSSGRDMHVYPLSDVDVICSLGYEYKKRFELDFSGFFDELRAVIQHQHPDWSLRQHNFVLKIEVEVGENAQDLPSSRPLKVHADVLFCFEGGDDHARLSSAHSKQRLQQLATLPQEFKLAAQILRTIIKSVSWHGKRPPLYCVDLFLKYIHDKGVHQACPSTPYHDDRWYLPTTTECFMFFRPCCLSLLRPCKCCICQQIVSSSFWECPKCCSVACSVECIGKLACAKAKMHKKRKESYPFPTETYKSFSKDRASRYSKYNNIWWNEPRKSSESSTNSLTCQLIKAFFFWGAYLDKAVIIFDESKIHFEEFRTPFVQDVGWLEQNIIAESYHSFISFCWRLIDDSSLGFISVEKFQCIRYQIFHPFRSLIANNSEITIFLNFRDYEQIFKFIVNPWVSFRQLFLYFRKEEKFDNPNCLFYDISRVVLLVDMQTIDDVDLPMAMCNVTFGTWIEVLDKLMIEKIDSNETDRSTLEYPNPFADILTQPHVLNTNQLRQDAFEWDYSGTNMGHQKVCFDKEAEVPIYFSASLNVVRNLGPDFDYNPLNFKEGGAENTHLDVANFLENLRGRT